MTVKHLNSVARRGRRRADELEPRLTRILTPILDRAGREAATAFTAMVTDHLTASAARTADRVALAAVPPAELRSLAASLALHAAADLTPRSTMVALYPRPDEAAALAHAGGEDAGVLHVTLAYLGEATDAQVAAVQAALGKVAGSHAPLSGVVGGIGSFDDYGNGHPAIVLPDVPGLVELRMAVCDAIAGTQADYSREHGFTAHTTVAYNEEMGLPRPDVLGLPLHFDELALVQGDVTVIRIPLTGARPLTAAGEPTPWTPPAPDEILNVDELVSTLRTKTDPVRLAVVQTMMGEVSKTVNAANGGNYALAPGLAVRDSSKINTTADLADFAKMPVATDGVHDYFTHAVRHQNEIDSIVKSGLQAPAGRVYGSAPPLIRDRGAGYVVFRVPAGTAKASTDIVEEGLHYPQFTVPDVAPEDIVKVVRQVTDRTGFSIREDTLASNMLAGKVTASDAADLPANYGSWLSLPTNAGISFDVTNPFVGRVLAQSGSQITHIAETTQLNVMRVIKASHNEGLSIPDTAKAIRAGMNDASPARATLIARTELAGVVNGASLASAEIVSEATDTTYTKQWLTAPGAPNPRHELYEDLDGQEVGLDEYFDVGGSQLSFPGDPDGDPGEVCNCRCTVIYNDASGSSEVDAEE